MISVVKEKYNKDKIKFLFYLLGLLFFLIFISSILLTHGETIKNYLFSDMKDTFMDFYNSLYQTVGRHPYKYGNIYPPLCYLLYLVFLRFIPIDQLYTTSKYLRESQGGIISCSIFVVFAILSIHFLNKRIKKGSESEKIIFSLLMLSSIPFLYAFERGNIIIYALISSMTFFLLKDSKSKWLRELALISLAISFSLKIYPAIFGFILLKEKRFKDIIRLIIYALIIFFVPFIFFGGFNSIKFFISNLTSTSNAFSEIRFNKLNFMGLFNYTLQFLNLKGDFFLSIIKIIYFALIILSFISSWITKTNWKRVMLLTLLLIGIPSFSFTYVGIFLVIPIIYFLDFDEKRNKLDFIYLILICFIMFANPIALFEHGNSDYFYSHISLNSKIISISIFLLTLILTFDVLISFIKSKNNLLLSQKKGKNKTKVKRVKYIDIARAIALFFVVLGHLVTFDSTFFNWIFSFHMPLFFILSGFCINFDKYDNFLLFVKHKIKTLIVPYFIFCLIAIIVCYLVPSWKSSAFSLISLKQILYYTQPELLHVGQIWFLIALFFSDILFYFLDRFIINKLKKGKIIIIIVSLIIMALIGWLLPQYISVPIFLRLPFKIDVALTSVVFIAIGYYSKKYNVFDKIIKKKYSLIIMILCLLVNIIFGTILNGYVNICNFDYSNILFYYISAISGSIFVIIISSFLENSEILKYYGNNSLSMFAFHSYFLIIAEIILSLIFKYRIKMMENIPIIAAIISAIIIYILLFFFAKIYNIMKKVLTIIFNEVINS